MNIISNAAEAIEETGETVVSTENCYIDKPVAGYDYIKDGDYAVFTVSDTGIGISPEDQQRIFEPFYTKKVMGRSGTGLGMAVVWGTVKDHNGYIDVQSEVGKEEHLNSIFLSPDELKKEKLRYRLNPTWEGEKVLIVDDIDEQREIASEMIKKLGYQCHVDFKRGKGCGLS